MGKWMQVKWHRLILWIKWKLKLGWTCVMRVEAHSGGQRWSESEWYCEATGETRREMCNRRYKF